MRAGFLTYFCGEIVAKGLIFLLFFVAGRAMDLESFSKLSLIHPAMQTLLVTFSFGFTNTISINFFSGRESGEELLGRILKSWSLCSVALFVLALIGFAFTADGREPVYFETCGTFLFLQLLSLSLLLGTYFQFTKNYFKYVINQLAYRASIFAAALIFVAQGVVFTFAQFIYISITVLSATTMFLVMTSVKFEKLWTAPTRCAQDIKSGLPLILNGLISYVAIVGPRFSLSATDNKSDLVTFSVLQTFVAALTILYASFSKTFAPTIFYSATVSKDRLGSIVDDLVSATIPVVAFGVPLVTFVTVLFSRFYFDTRSIDVVLIALLCVPFLFQLFYATHVDVLYANKKGAYVTCILAGAAGLTYFASVALYASLGLRGVAIAASASAVMQYVLIYIMTRRLLGRKLINLRTAFYLVVSLGLLNAYIIAADTGYLSLIGFANIAALTVFAYKLVRNKKLFSMQ